MVTILAAGMLAIAAIAAMEFVALVVKSKECERLIDELHDMQEIKPIIDENGRWQDWDGERT